MKNNGKTPDEILCNFLLDSTLQNLANTKRLNSLLKKALTRRGGCHSVLGREWSEVGGQGKARQGKVEARALAVI